MITTASNDAVFSDAQKMRFGGIAFIVVGIGTLLFGGTVDSGTYIEIFGFRFGRGEQVPMSRGASLFWGLVMIIGGAAMIKYSYANPS